MTHDQVAVAEANEAFYAAITSADLAAMSAVWFPADWAECVHPGWASLRGWEVIREAWRAIFDSGPRASVGTSDVRVRLLGDVAWVSCLERIATTEGDRIHTSLAQATNLFVRHDGRWRMAVHHASPVPFTTVPATGSGQLVN
jgi:uncharacterized protein (TIGR02246 family)